MLSRLASVFGFVAHLGDALISPFRLSRPRAQLAAGTARVPGSALVGAVLIAIAVASFVNGMHAEVNKDPATYTVAQLTSGADRGGRDYATVNGEFFEMYVDESTSNGGYQFTYYLLRDPGGSDGDQWIVVRSDLPEIQMEKLVSADGSVTLTGIIANDTSAVDSTKRTLGSTAPSRINPSLVFRQGDAPIQAGSLYSLAAICGTIGGILFFCWLMTLVFGYVPFRPAAGRSSLHSIGGSGFLPVRVTGLLSGYTNGIRARELKAQLLLPPAVPNAGPPPLDLTWPTRRGRPTGVRLTPGVTGAVVGTAYSITGARPAIKARFGRFDILLSFESERARDGAFDQLCVSAQLTVGTDGISASSAG